MKRAPRYNKSRNYRLVSLPGGLWQTQHHSGQNGSQTFDPWIKIGHPIADLTEAASLNLLSALDEIERAKQ